MFEILIINYLTQKEGKRDREMEGGKKKRKEVKKKGRNASFTLI